MNQRPRIWGTVGDVLPAAVIGLLFAGLAALTPLPTDSDSGTSSLTQTGGDLAAGLDASGSAVGEAFGTDPAGAAAGRSAAGRPGAAGGGVGTGTGATGVSTDTPYQGVSATTVKWGFSAQDKGCGGFDQGQVAASFGISSNPGRAYEVNLEYWNKYPLVDFPLPPEIRRNVNPENGYWGRRITSVFRDSGGFACQDVGRANAVTMAEKDKVFGLVQRGNEGPEVPMSLVMAQRKLIHIGRQNTGPLWWSQRAPYSWDGMWGSSDTQMPALGSWVCRDWKSGKANRTSDPVISTMDRKHGILYPDDPLFREAVSMLQAELDKCGLKPARYAYPVDLATLEANAETVVARMKADGVTTGIIVTDFISMLFVSKSATAQQYFPEWVRSGWGMGSYPVTYRTFTEARQARNTWIATDTASINSPSYRETEAYLAFKRIRPNEEPDSDWPSYYYQFKIMAIGMAGAGRNLTPTTFAQGLARLCNPCPRSDPLQPLERIYPGHYANKEGFTLAKWNPDKNDPTSPPDSNGNPPKGYFEFIENGKRYGLRISDPG